MVLVPVLHFFNAIRCTFLLTNTVESIADESALAERLPRSENLHVYRL